MKSFIPWIGRKGALIDEILPRFPTDYYRYVEVFGGGASVLFAKTRPNRFEIYNDYQINLVNLFRVVKEKPLSFLLELNLFPINSREDFNHLKNLRLLVGDEITVFPGVELRTYKGGSNVHVILIFSEQIDIKNLSQDFESKMLRSKAIPDKENSTNEEIYWDYNDIINFANEHDAIISIHSGSKSNGIDDKISNKLEHNRAVKKEFSQTVGIFEVSSLKDIEGYNKHVFSKIPSRPVIICSDNYNPKEYNTSEYLWIKSKLTFSGLKQAIIHSDQRIYVGDLPPKLHSVKLSPEKYISTVRIKKNTYAKNKDNWFDVDQPINVGITTIIGNKGSGKSALADLIGYIGQTDNSDNFTFLSN